jgi:hypothetical protein
MIEEAGLNYETVYAFAKKKFSSEIEFRTV